MVLIALLVAALVCLALGLILASAPWLLGSLAASAVAAVVLYRNRNELAAPARQVASADAEPAADAEADPNTQVWVVDGRPDFHLASCPRLAGADAETVPLAQAREDGFTPCGSCRPLDATSPFAGAPVPAAVGASAAEAERGGWSGTRLAGTPSGAGSGGTDAGPASGAAPDEVWVVDGRPDFHVRGCARLAGQADEPVPLAQALEDGFAPCPVCAPLAEATDEAGPYEVAEVAGAAEPVDMPAAEAPVEPVIDQPVEEAAPLTVGPPVTPIPATDPSEPAAPDEPAADALQPPIDPDVWVVDEHPDFHRADCAALGAQGEPIPLSQATEDGFTPCAECRPLDMLKAAAAAAAGAGNAQVWVVDGRPHYHAASCIRLTYSDAELIPHAQAVADGFVPCELCDPLRAPAAAPATAEDADVAEPDATTVLPAITPGETATVEPVPAAAGPPVDAALPVEQETVGEPEAAPPELDALLEPEPEQPVVPEPEAVSTPTPEPEALADATVEPEHEPAPEADPVVLRAPEPEPVRDVEPEPEVHAEPAPPAVSEPLVEPEPLPEPVPDAAAAEPELEPEPAAEAEAVAEPEPEPAPEPQPELARDTGRSGADVWVIDGRPRFHVVDCLIIRDKSAVAIPLEQATADGFMPCSLCDPLHTRAS